jgi:hypothetical protein
MKDNLIQARSMDPDGLRKLLAEYPSHEGSKLLALLLTEPNRPVLSTVIELALTLKLTLREAEQGFYHPVGIPLTDEQTLRDVDRELQRLIAQKAAYLAQHKAEDSPFDEDIRHLIRYRKQCTKPWGAIKHSDDELRKAYRRHYAAIQRLLARAEKDGHHEAVAEVKRTLKLGYSSVLRRV